MRRPALRPQLSARAHVSRHREPDDAEPARGEPRADDPATSSSRPRSSICSRPPGFSSWCTTGSCTSGRAPEDGVDIPLAPVTTGRSRACGCRDRCPTPRRRLDAAAGLRQSEQPLVGRIADLRIRSGGAAKLRTGEGGKLKVEADEAAAGRSGHRHAPERVHRQLVDRSRDAAHAVHLRAQPHLRSARQGASRLERRAAVHARPS